MQINVLNFAFIILFNFSSILVYSSGLDSLNFWKTNESILCKNLTTQQKVSFYEKGYETAKQHKSNLHTLFFGRRLATNLLRLKNLDEAKILLDEVHQLADNQDEYYELAVIESNLGYYFKLKEKHKKALNHFKQSVVNHINLQNDSLTAIARLNLAQQYKNRDIYKKATKQVVLAIPILERYKDYKNLAAAYDCYGNIESIQGDFRKAHQNYTKALQIRLSIDNQYSIGKSYNNIGLNYSKQEKIDSALFFLNLSLKLKEQLLDTHSVANTLSNIGSVYLKNQEIDKGLSTLKKALDFSYVTQPKSESITCEVSIKLGQHYLNDGEYNLSYPYLTESDQLSQRLGDFGLRKKVLLLLIQYYNYAGENNRTIPLFYELITVKDSIDSRENSKEVTALEVEFELDKQVERNKLLDIESKRKEAELKIEKAENKVLILSLVLLVVLCSIALFQFHSRSKHNKMLLMLLKEEQHRIKNFLQVIQSIFRMHARKAENRNVKEAIEEGNGRLTSMLLLQKQLREPTLNNHGKVNFNKYLRDLVDHICMSYESNHDYIQFDLAHNYFEMDVNTATNAALIINEVINNAFKYALPYVEEPKLTIQSTTIANGIEIIVKDNGPGIDLKEDIDHSNSLGMRFIHLFCQNMNATHSFSNQNGTVFQLTINQ